jgi:hypothetical protein
VTAARAKKKGPGRGRVKVIDPKWWRRAYFVEGEVAHALEVLAAQERVPVSIIANRALKAYVGRRRGK